MKKGPLLAADVPAPPGPAMLNSERGAGSFRGQVPTRTLVLGVQFPGPELHQGHMGQAIMQMS